MTSSASIELWGLAKSFHDKNGPVPAVRGVDLTVGRGETVALLGPNGAGKSTTLDMLLGLTKPDAGRVSIFGKDIRRPSRPVRSARCCRRAA